MRARARVVAIARHHPSASSVRRSVDQSLGRRDWIKRRAQSARGARASGAGGAGGEDAVGDVGWLSSSCVSSSKCGFVLSSSRCAKGWLTRKARAASIG